MKMHMDKTSQLSVLSQKTLQHTRSFLKNTLTLHNASGKMFCGLIKQWQKKETDMKNITNSEVWWRKHQDLGLFCCL